MSKIKPFLKTFFIIIVCIIALIILNNQGLEMRMFICIYALILYLAYLANQRFEQLTKDKFYLCTFEKQIIAADSDEVLAGFEIKYKLPFVPYIGLEVVGDTDLVPAGSDNCDNHDFQEFYTGYCCQRYGRVL